MYNVCREIRYSVDDLAFFSPALTRLGISATCTGRERRLPPLVDARLLRKRNPFPLSFADCRTFEFRHGLQQDSAVAAELQVTGFRKFAQAGIERIALTQVNRHQNELRS